MSPWELTHVVQQVVLPPGVLILLGLLGFVIARSHFKAGAALGSFALVALYLLATPVVGRSLLQSLEERGADPTLDMTGRAIVVLGGGSYFRAPEYGRDTVNAPTLERLRYAAHLQRRTGKPILVAGGDPVRGGSTEAEQMKAALTEFGGTAQWIEGTSNNTLENARNTQKLMRETGIDSVYLVTHAWHMPRASMAFRRAGLIVIPAPLGYSSTRPTRVPDFFPSANALAMSSHFFHEILGLAWYRLQFARGS
jgi:uncharacterized SAM-binding protein YcdF (DUF218 family)